MNTEDQIKLDYEAYLKLCEEKNIEPVEMYGSEIFMIMKDQLKAKLVGVANVIEIINHQNLKNFLNLVI